ncbi:MAG: ion channel DMI1 [Gemmatimonadota bacterium]
MPRRNLDRLKFWLERFLLKGPHYRLAFIAAMLGLLSVVCGALVLRPGPFNSLGEAVWWAFLRLSDPGYLGDDEGLWMRTVSTLLTVSGYVLFLGSLVAIMTQWLNATITRLESGLTPVARNGHVVILGWTNRTVPIVQELLLSETRVKRFLQRHGARQLHIVVLCDEVTPALRQDLKEQLDELWDERHITLRTGSSLRTEHLERVDFLNAAVILVPGGNPTGEGTTVLDTRTIKVLLSISAAAAEAGDDPPPYLVAEVFDARKVAIAQRSYAGPLELVASDMSIARIMVQNLRHPGLSGVYNELLSQGDGNEIYLPEGAPLAGVPVEALGGAFPRGVVLGILRSDGSAIRPYLNPGPGLTVEEDDRIVLLARSFADTQGPAQGSPRLRERGTPGTLRPRQGARRVLILGWSQKAPALLNELATYEDESIQVDLFTSVPIERRRSSLERQGVDAEAVGLRHIEGDFAVHAELAKLHPMEYDNILLMGSDSLRTGQEADARTILGALLLREMARTHEHPPSILAELLDPQNVSLLDRGAIEVMVSPILVSHVLAQVALRRELRVVFEELLTAGGAEVVFRPPSHFGLTGRGGFEQIQDAAAARGETALGVRVPRRGQDRNGWDLTLNPDRGTSWNFDGASEVVALATYPEESPR